MALIEQSSATLNPNSKKNKQKTPQDIKMNSGPVHQNVFERDLVEAEPLASTIVSEAHTYFEMTGLKNFNNTCLGYVTPVRNFFIIYRFLIINNS